MESVGKGFSSHSTGLIWKWTSIFKRNRTFVNEHRLSRSAHLPKLFACYSQIGSNWAVLERMLFGLHWGLFTGLLVIAVYLKWLAILTSFNNETCCMCNIAAEKKKSAVSFTCNKQTCAAPISRRWWDQLAEVTLWGFYIIYWPMFLFYLKWSVWDKLHTFIVHMCIYYTVNHCKHCKKLILSKCIE